jgi:hypothetical protein
MLIVYIAFLLSTNKRIFFLSKSIAPDDEYEVKVIAGANISLSKKI